MYVDRLAIARPLAALLARALILAAPAAAQPAMGRVRPFFAAGTRHTAARDEDTSVQKPANAIDP